MCITAQTTLKRTEQGGRAGNRQSELWYETDNIATEKEDDLSRGRGQAQE